ncbi:oxidoreductase [Amycolatopsis sp. ATCC 39116]|uniref:oxidoreductase n=1 Tax=Amycolatopsis sp. (strain ATCC 39116 / 75iv2) TaxID=385957 RepID=UPI0002F0ABA6|nr:oxidoreductase [Amycolatopsis sp. ATCC 39116]
MWSTKDIPEQRGRVAVVTGANGGLGLATATALAARGAHVVVAARDRWKADQAGERIRAAHPRASVEIVPLDLASLKSVRSAAADILTRHSRVDLLINNAGVMAVPESVTADGFETQFAVNHLGHWVLTAGLLPALVRTPGARVVTLTSTAQHSGRAVTDGRYLGRPYTPWRAYDTSKLANRHFAQGLDRQFRAAGISARALTAHPGFTNSDLFDTTRAAGAAGVRGKVLRSVARSIGMDTEHGVLSQLRAATDPDAEGGTMYGPRWVVTGPPVARRLIRPGADRAIGRLWQMSRRLTGVDVDVAGALAESVSRDA